MSSTTNNEDDPKQRRAHLIKSSEALKPDINHEHFTVYRDDELLGDEDELRQALIDYRSRVADLVQQDPHMGVPTELLVAIDSKAYAALQTLITKSVVAERKNIHEQIRAIHMSHDWNDTSEDLRQWLQADLHNIQRLEQSLNGEDK